MAPIHSACLMGKIDRVQQLLDQGASIETMDDQGRTPLWLAAMQGYEHLAHFLLERRADLDVRVETANPCRTPLQIAAMYNHWPVVDYLLREGAGPAESSSFSILHKACATGALVVVRTLLARGVNPNSLDSGRTPLHQAARYDHSEIVVALLEGGADPTRPSGDEPMGEPFRTVEEHARRLNRIKIADLLQAAVLPRPLTVWLMDATPHELTLNFTTLSGNLAATLQWPVDEPPAALPGAVLAAIRASGFTGLAEPLLVSNLRLVKSGKDGSPLAVGRGAPPLAEQLSGPDA